MKPSFFIPLVMIIFMIVFNCSMAQLPSGWETVDKSKRPLVEYYARLACPDSMNCMIWIARKINGFDGQAFRRSTDGGQTWKTVFEEAGYEKENEDWVILPTINVISYPNEKLFIAGGDSGLIIRTTDKGNTWQKTFIDKNFSIDRLNMLDENYGIIVGCTNDFDTCKTLFTYDGGLTWKAVIMPGNMGFYEFDIINPNLFYSLITFNDHHPSGLHLLKVHDNWASWDTIRLPQNILTGNLDFISEKEGWVAGGYWGMDIPCEKITQQIYYTSDGGESWIKQRDTHRTCDVITDIKMYNDKFGIGQSCAALVVLTSDGGNTWEENFLEDVDPMSSLAHCITSVQAPTANTAFACYDGSKILKYTGPPVGVEEPPGDDSGGIRLSPNPASDYIEINLGRWTPSVGWSPSDLTIYNSLGECVMNLTPALSEGEGARIDVSGLPSGVYYMKYGTYINKFVKM